MSTFQFEFDPSLGSFVKGLPLTDTSFLAVSQFNQLQVITRHPADLQPNARRSGYDAEAVGEEAEVHELVQRALTGKKKANVGSYAEYIAEVVSGDREGVLPPIHLWSPHKLEVVPGPGGHTFALVPNGEHLPAIDGETQLTAHFEVRRSASPELRSVHGRFPLALVVHHGVDVPTAQLYFHDLNVLAVRPNVSLGLSMDSKDPVMEIVNEIEHRVPQLTGRVERQARQLRKNSPKVITTQALRQMTINVAKGISGVQYGARPAPLDGVDLADLKSVARSWISGYFSRFLVEIADRQGSLAGSPAILAAVGAMGRDVLNAPPHQRAEIQENLLQSLSKVDWTKGQQWVGIAGTIKQSGFSVGGTKEVAYAVHAALADPTDPAFARLRP